MEFSTYSLFSQPGQVNESWDNNEIMMDGFLDSIHDILGQDFLDTYDPFYSLSHNVPPGGSTATLSWTDPQPCPGSLPLDSGPPPQQQEISVDRAPSDAPVILHFGDMGSPKNDPNNASWHLNGEEGLPEFRNGAQTANKNSRERPQSQTYDHIVSERKRRKLLSEQFITLSGMVPGLKKMDKTSVMGATIEYMRNLQQRTEVLEEKLAKETIEYAVLVRKSHITVEQEEDEGSSDDNGGCGSYKQTLPQIEAKVCNNQALLKIHCEKQKGIMTKILAEVDNLNLSVLHSNLSPFGNSALDITIMVEMDKECTLKANQMVQALLSALRTVS